MSAFCSLFSENSIWWFFSWGVTECYSLGTRRFASGWGCIRAPHTPKHTHTHTHIRVSTLPMEDDAPQICKWWKIAWGMWWKLYIHVPHTHIYTHTHIHTHTQSDYWGHPYRVSGFFSFNLSSRIGPILSIYSHSAPCYLSTPNGMTHYTMCAPYNHPHGYWLWLRLTPTPNHPLVQQRLSKSTSPWSGSSVTPHASPANQWSDTDTMFTITHRTRASHLYYIPTCWGENRFVHRLLFSQSHVWDYCELLPLKIALSTAPRCSGPDKR